MFIIMCVPLLFKTSLNEILEERKGDPEMILQNLGFSGSYSDVNCRIPDRFLLTPSNAYGISVEKFLDGNPKLREFLEEKNAIQNPFEMMMTSSAEGQSDDNLNNSHHLQLLSLFQQLISNLVVREVPLSYLASCAALIRGLSSTAINDCICHTYCQIMRSRCGLQLNQKNQTSSVRCTVAGPVTLVPPISTCVMLGPTASHQEPLQAAEVTASNEDISKQGSYLADLNICHKQSDLLGSDNQLNVDLKSNIQLNVRLRNDDSQLNDYPKTDNEINEDLDNQVQSNDRMRNDISLNDYLTRDTHLSDPLRSDVALNDFYATRDDKIDLWSGDSGVQNEYLGDGQWRAETEDHSGGEPYRVLHSQGDGKQSDAYTCRASCEFVKLYFGQRCLEVDEEGRSGDEAFDLQMDWCMPGVTLASADRSFNREESQSQNRDSRCASVEFVDADDYCYIDDCVAWSAKNRTEFNDDESRGRSRDRENREEEQSTTGGMVGLEDFCVYNSSFKEGDDEYFYDDVVWPTESFV